MYEEYVSFLVFLLRFLVSSPVAPETLEVFFAAFAAAPVVLAGALEAVDAGAFPAVDAGLGAITKYARVTEMRN